MAEYELCFLTDYSPLRPLEKALSWSFGPMARLRLLRKISDFFRFDASISVLCDLREQIAHRLHHPGRSLLYHKKLLGSYQFENQLRTPKLFERLRRWDRAGRGHDRAIRGALDRDAGMRRTHFGSWEW